MKGLHKCKRARGGGRQRESIREWWGLGHSGQHSVLCLREQVCLDMAEMLPFGDVAQEPLSLLFEKATCAAQWLVNNTIISLEVAQRVDHISSI